VFPLTLLLDEELEEVAFRGFHLLAELLVRGEVREAGVELPLAKRDRAIGDGLAVVVGVAAEDAE
jgi:hypothetical protein